MKLRFLSVFCIFGVCASALGQPDTVRSGRFTRGTGTNANYHSFVIPLDGQKGLECADIGGLSEQLLDYWFTGWTLYHLNATNLSGDIPFENPIAMFGSRAGGNPLHVGEHYRFAAYAGVPTNYNSSLWIATYEKTNGTVVYRSATFIPLPNPTNATNWNNYLTNGYIKTVTASGLTTTVTFNQTYAQFGATYPGTMVLTHSADSSTSNYIFGVELRGITEYGYQVLLPGGFSDFSRLYTLEFEQRPPWRAVFLDQPHFAGEPLPPSYQGKSLDELLTNSPPVITTFSLSNAPAAYTNLDQSPELRRHPILDQFVSDMRNDPVALTRYVHNEIELTDAIDYNDNGSLSEVSVNPPGVARGALGTFMEGQGGPVEQCALLVYLLRQSGTPAVYVYPPHNGLKMLDSQLSRILRMQFSGAVNNLGQLYTTNTLIPANYPWVAAYIGTNWVHLFPWLKDTQIEEGLNLRDYMSTEYPNGYKWVYGYLYGHTNILSLATDDDTAGVLFPRWLQNNLAQVAPGVSLDDLGVRCVNRRHSYARWTDFPSPFTTPTNGVALDSLSSTAITNVFPGLTNIFDTFSVDISSHATPSKKVSSGDLRMVDLHNRRFLIRHLKTGANTHNMILSLAAFRTNATGPTNFTVGDTLLNLQYAKTNLTSSDDTIDVKLTYRRHRSLPVSVFTNLPSPNLTYARIDAQTILTDNLTIRKGDLAAICINVGRVTRAMLNVHAGDLWNMEQTLAANPSATNSVSPDLYQGGTAYLMGMAYYENASRFQDEDAQLYKVRVVSHYGHGLAKLAAKHVSGQLPNSGDVILNQPGVDMSTRSTALAYSATIHPASGEEKADALSDFADINIAHGSAEEHQILNSFFRESDSISTVKLLQLAQSRSGPGIQWLNYSNYIQVGNSNFSGTLLKNSDTTVWASVTNFFATFDARIRQVFMTPGAITNKSNTYKGVGALLMSPGYSYAALISANQNGGVAPVVSDEAFTAPNTVNYSLQLDPSGNYYLNTTAPGSGNITLAPDSYAGYDADAVANNAALNYFNITGQQNLWTGSSMDLFGLSSQGSLSANYSQSVLAANGDEGFFGRVCDGVEQAFCSIFDPVHAVTGEFYVNATDLALPGPMPLTVSRNYSSQNLANNEFGYGWKLNYMPYLSLSTNTSVIYAAEPGGAVLAYEQTATNANIYLPTTAKNPQLNNNSTAGIGSTANRLRNRIEKQTSGPDTFYYLYPPTGGKRTFKVMSFTGSVNRTRPYLTLWEDSRGNAFAFEYGFDSTKADFAEVRRIQSSNGGYLGFSYDVYGHITEAYTGDGRRLSYDYDQFGDLVGVTLPDQSSLGFEYEHKTQNTTNGATITTNLYSTHLLLKEDKPDGRALKNEYDQHRRVTNQWATVGADLNLVRNASFIYANNFDITNSFTNTITGYTLTKDVFNNTNRYEYTNGLVTKITDALNQTIVQDWYEAAETNKAGYYPRSLESRADKRGLVTQFKYDANGNVTNTVTTGDLTGDGTTPSATNMVAYDANNLPTLTTDPVGNQVQTLYHSQFAFLPEYVVRLSGGTPISTNQMVYASVTNTFVSGGVSYTNLARGLLQRSVRASGSPDAATNEWAYDGRGFITQSVAFTGTGDSAVTNTMFYSDRGELIEQTDGDGRAVRQDHDPMGRLTHREVYESNQTVPLAWDYTYYNENGEVTWKDGAHYNPEDYRWHDYDGAGRPITEIRWRSQAKSDGTGVEAPPEAGLYAQTFQQYDAFGNLLRVVNPQGVITTNTWDAIGQLVSRKVIETNGAVLTSEGFAYEPGGQVRYQTNALGGVTETQYTSSGQPKYRKGADGSTNGWRYYLDSRPRREIQRNGAYWETTYDDVNRTATRIFYTASGAPQATHSTVVDRRGNVVQRTDAGGNVFTNSYDGLDRLKRVAGPVVLSISATGMDLENPVYVTNYSQQVLAYLYDASGRVTTTTNALGEKTVTTRDAMGRSTSVQTYAAGAGTPLHATATAYTADHHGMTVTNGADASAIITAAYTDNDGHALLAITHPSATVREFTRSQYDLTGNLTYEERNSASNNTVTVWSSTSYGRDGLNRVTSKRDRDNALTTYAYDAASDLTNRTMPGGLLWNATYNNAGQMTKDWNVGSGGTGTRTNTYAYYTTGNALAGLLQTQTDGIGLTSTYLYDAWLRPATNIHTSTGWQNKNTSWTYDARGLLTGMAQWNDGNYAITLTRAYDAYGQMNSDAVSVPGLLSSGAGQSWDAAGRRSGLDFGSFRYNYAWRADGLLASVSTPNGGASYAYDSAGVLTNRTVMGRVTTVSARDGAGRPLTITSKANLVTKLTETLAYTGDGLLNSHTLAREDFTDSRSYSYANLSRRLTEERLNLDGGTRWTNAFTFDGGTAAGPGVLTKISGTNSASWIGVADAFARVNVETNVMARRPAYGKVNGDSTVSVSVDGNPMPVAMIWTGNASWPWQWRTTMELASGAHQLTVNAAHPSGLFTTNATVTFTNNAANEVVTETFDGRGKLTQRIWKSPSGTTNRTQTLEWDALGRLELLTDLDASQNGYYLNPYYDPLNRRVFTYFVPMTGGLPVNVRYGAYYFDPQVEFLELGQSEDYEPADWKVYGPDLNGRYGGLNGTGGFEAVTDGPTLTPVLSDARGNVLGMVTNSTVAWTASRPTAYGAVPGHRPLPLWHGADVAQASAWRGRWADASGYVWLGARYYNPESGSFLDSDPMWNERDPNYHSFAGGDPINYFDADGRLGRTYRDAALTLRDQSDSVADAFLAMPAGGVGALLMGLGSIPSVFSEASAGMAQANQEISTYTGAEAFLANTLRLPANFAFGTTALINNPFGTVPQIPGAIAQLPGNVSQNGQNFYNDPSFYSAFNLVENGIQVAGLYAAGAGIYRGGANLLSPAPAVNEVSGLQVGTPIYRVFGGDARGYGSSWTTVDPSTVPNFRAAAGLYPGNAGTWVAEGEVGSLQGVRYGPANAGPTTPPGQVMLPEVLFQPGTAAGQVRVNAVYNVQTPH